MSVIPVKKHKANSNERFFSEFRVVMIHLWMVLDIHLLVLFIDLRLVLLSGFYFSNLALDSLLMWTSFIG